MDKWKPEPLDPGQLTPHRRGRGKPIVLLHCLGQSWRFWDVLDPLMDRNELIAYNFPGHLDTPLPGHQYGASELTEQLAAAAMREGLAKFHLMGISLGGGVAQHFAGTYPDMVDRLVLADCTPRYDDESRANWPVRNPAATDADPRFMTEAFNRQLVGVNAEIWVHTCWGQPQSAAHALDRSEL